jgi:hypothetical protein
MTESLALGSELDLWALDVASGELTLSPTCSATNLLVADSADSTVPECRRRTAERS